MNNLAVTRYQVLQPQRNSVIYRYSTIQYPQQFHSAFGHRFCSGLRFTFSLFQIALLLKEIVNLVACDVLEGKSSEAAEVADCDKHTHCRSSDAWGVEGLLAAKPTQLRPDQPVSFSRISNYEIKGHKPSKVNKAVMTKLCN